jgi:hypothetical protein
MNGHPCYSITSSTRTRKDSGIASASAFAVLRLTANSILDGSSPGRSAGLAPLRTLSTWLKLLLNEEMTPEMLRERDPRKLIPSLHGALLKNEQDVHLFERLAFLSRRDV